MTLVQKHTSPYNAAASDLVVHVHCRQFFSAKRRERLGRGTGGVTGTTSRIGGGLTTAGTGFWCDDTNNSSSSLSDSESQASDDGDSGRFGWWSESTTEEWSPAKGLSGGLCARDHLPQASSCTCVDRRKGVASPGAVPVAKSPGSCCGQARGCISRHGRLLVVRAQLLACR